MKKIVFGVLFAVMGLPLLTAASRVVVRETFVDGERETFAPPSSLAWRVSAEASARLAGAALVLEAPRKGVTTAVAHLAAPGEAIAIPPGGRLVVKLRLTLRGPANDSVNGLRVGLLHTGTQRMSRDGVVPAGAAEGYVVTVNAQNGAIMLRKRTSEKGPWIAALSAKQYQTLPTTGRGKSGPWQEGKVAELEIVVSRTAGGAGSLSAGFASSAGARVTRLAKDAGPVPERFDTVVVALQAGVAPVAIEAIEVHIEP